MTHYHQTKRLALCLLTSALLTTPSALGQQAPDGSRPPLQASAAMTLYHVLVGGNGQQYYLNQYGQAIPLPGAGSADSKSVAIYTGNGGESWYVDKKGQQIDLPALATPPAEPAYYGYQQPAPYYAAPPPGGYQQENQPPQQQPNINIVNEQPSGSAGGSGGSGGSGLGSMLAAGVGAAAGAFGGAAMDMALGGIPYGMPIYPGYGGMSPYYMGADGNPVYVNKTVNNNNVINDWNKQNNWYNKQVNEQNGRYNNNNWPGREHGFPPPGQQVPGRLYQPQNRGGEGNIADRGGSWGHQVFGGGHFGGGGLGHFGGGSFGHFGGFGRR